MKNFAFCLDDDFESQIEDIFEKMTVLHKIPGKKIGNFLIKKIKATRAGNKNNNLERWS